jgi:alkylation response protein AidB-like acyl-CoA dehydrogenase
MYSLHLSPEQLEFRDTVREFVNDEIKPLTLKSERLDLGDRSTPVEVLRKASLMGLRTLALPEELGGVGADALTCCIVTEELAVGDTDVAAVLSETSALGRILFTAMSSPQRERLLPSFLDDDDYHLALAKRELGDDTSLGVNYHRTAVNERGMATTATQNGGDWVINGVKDCVANAPIKLRCWQDRQGVTLLVPRSPASVNGSLSRAGITAPAGGLC